jgi:trehalose 2-sulfotransferase
MRNSSVSAKASQLSLSYVVASTPGTGSSLLCRGLTQTGVVGQPDEYLAPLSYRGLAAKWGFGPEGLPATTRIARAMQHTATSNGVFAVHAHWYDFATLLRTIRNVDGPVDLLGNVDRLLANPRYVHISRRDTAAQALSYYRAIYRGEVNMSLPPPPDPAYDGPETVLFEQVRWLEDMLIDWDAQWQAYFARCDIRPLRVFYEDVVANYGPTVERVLDYLGFASTPTVSELEAPSRMLQSEWIQRWLDQYRAARDRFAPQPAVESWSRADRMFDLTHGTEVAGSLGNGGASTSTSRRENEVVYSCVVDKPPFLVYQSLIWVLTLTRLAGVAPQRLVVHVVEGTDPEHLEILRSLGVRVVPVARFDERNVYANKLRQLTEGALTDASTAVLSDCDIAYTEDITPFTGGAAIRGKSVASGVPTLLGWRHLLDAAGLTRSLRLGRSSSNRMVWTCTQNLNGGLLVIRGRFHDLLAEAWPRWFRWILDHGDELAADVNRFAGQVSFGLALIELDLPIERMPEATNFSLGGASGALRDGTTPVAIHYHRWLTPAGRLSERGVPAVDAVIAKVNAQLDEPASREVLEVALHNWQATLGPLTSRSSKLKLRRLLSRMRNP